MHDIDTVLTRDNCIFCQIIRRKAPAQIIYENDDIICFLPREMEVYGHTLIVPKHHWTDLYDIPENMVCELAKIAKRISIAYRDKIDATGVNLLHATGVDGQQSIFHFHIHLLPRFKDDKLNTWPRLPVVDIDREELMKRLRFD